MLNQSELSRIIMPLLEDKLAKYGFGHAEISSSFDHDDDPIVIVRISYNPHAQPIKGEDFLDLLGSVSTRLADSGDSRPVHFQHIYADGEEADDRLPSVGHRKKRPVAQ